MLLQKSRHLGFWAAFFTWAVATRAAASRGSLDLDSLGATAQIWHITDVHVDPNYVLNSVAGDGCYCNTHLTCPRFPPSCAMSPEPFNWSVAAAPFGSPENKCATPPALWASAMQFMASAASDTPLVFFTGDFGDAGLSAACADDSTGPEAQAQIIRTLTSAWLGVRAAVPGAKVYGVLGNHDSAPGDVFGDTADMSWLYQNLTLTFGSSFSNDTQAQATLLQGGWYVTQALPGLYVLGLNTNYWTILNSALANVSGTAYALGMQQLSWLNESFASIATSSADGQARVYILGHIPPRDSWLPGIYPKYRAILSQYAQVVVAEFFGHNHVDEMTIVRSCTPPPAPGPTPTPVQWLVTPGVNWCSGGNLPVGNVFGAGVEPDAAWCPYVPSGTVAYQVGMCEALCGNSTQCAGFTWYPNMGTSGACCFRTDVSDMPLNASSPAVCYAKEVAGPCSGGPETPLHMLYAGPSLTEGYPATNPALRLFTVALPGSASAPAYDIVGMTTYYANITRANDVWAMIWQEEYEATQQYGLPDLSAASWAAAFASMATDNSPAWASFYSSMRKAYVGPSTVPCSNGTCKDEQIAWMNATALYA